MYSCIFESLNEFPYSFFWKPGMYIIIICCRPIIDRPIRGRGGLGRGRGGRGRGMGRGDGFDSRGKREFDRHSGSDRS